MNGMGLGWTALACVLAVTLLAIAYAVVVGARHQRIVHRHSPALAELRALNASYTAKLRYLPPVNYDVVDEVDSKTKVDRYDLRRLMMVELADQDASIQHDIDARLEDWATYLDYCSCVEMVRDRRLGATETEHLSAAKFARIERRLLAKQKLLAPTCAVHMRGVVTCPRPHRHSYARTLDWGLNDLVQALGVVRGVRRLERA